MEVFFERFCTYCGGTVRYFITEEGFPLGVCKCGNIDWCDNWDTVEKVINHYGKKEN